MIELDAEIKQTAQKIFSKKRYRSVFPHWVFSHIGCWYHQSTLEQRQQLLVYLKEKETNKECSLHTGHRKIKAVRHHKQRQTAMGISEGAWKRLRLVVIERDFYQCQHCKKYCARNGELTVDHIIPISQGGKTELANLQVLCNICHHEKDKFV